MEQSKKGGILLLIILSIIIIFVVKCSFSDNETTVSKEETVLFTSQKVLKDYNFTEYKTSSSIQDWTITNSSHEDTYRWVAVTYANGTRLKWIFEWSGDTDDDLVLKYLLVAGEEIVNKLNY